DEVVRLMVAAVGAAIEMMDVDEGGVTAAGDGAPAVVAPDDGSLGGGRDGLRGSAWRREVDAAELLGVALGAFDADFVGDDLFTCCLLGRHSAAVAGGERDLIAAQSFVATGGAAEEGARHG